VIETGVWLTPAGHEAVFQYRFGTSDWNTISACLRNPLADTGDEYNLPTGLSGWALDIGAHIGAVTIGLLLDNPQLMVLAIEAVPDNAALIRANAEANGVADRAVVWNKAAWTGRGNQRVEFNYRGNEVAEVHRFIGSVSPWIDKAERDYASVPTATLAQALAVTGGQGFEWVKSDCEGCEHPFLKGPGLAKLGVIEGEWHVRDGTPESLAAQLAATHEVTLG
jgi:FkbM family methyltransferase